MAVQTRIQVRRGSLSQWNAATSTLGNGVLYQGEIGYETDTGRFKIGDGSTAWSSLNYASVLPSNFVAGSGISLSQGSNGSTLTISLSNPNIQVSNITDFAEGVDDRVASLLTQGSGIGLTYNDSANTLSVAVTGIPSSLVTNFASSVNSLIDSAVSTSIVAGSGIDIVYNSGNNTLTVSSPLTAGSGISLSHSSGNYVVSLSNPAVELSNITDLSTNARNFLLTSSSANLGTLVTDETGSGSLVFSNSPTLTTPNITFSTAATVTASVAIPPVQGNAPLTADYNVITSATSNPAHVTLPAATVGRRIVVVNRGANPVSVFPATGASIDGGATNATVVLPVNGYVEFYAANGTTWYSTFNGSTNISAVGGINSNVYSFLSSGSSSALSAIPGFGKTGSGDFVLATGPTLVTPNIGVATGTSFNSITGLSSATPLVDGTAAVGTSTAAARADHVHPTDTSRAAVAGTLEQFASTTSSQLAGVISDETGTGSLVFANNPTMSGVTVNGNLTVGGSGLVASNINNFDTAVRTSRLDQMAVPTADVSLNSRKITNLADPTADQDAATKAYVDAARSGLDVKQSVRVATTGNITLGSATTTIDGITLNLLDRVLVKDQSTASENGIYVVSPGSWIRATDADSSAEVTAGMFTFVSEGTVNADSGWVLTTNDTITLGTTALAFAQFSGAGQITAGSGLTKSGNTLDVGTASSSRIVVNADNIDLATVTQSDNSSIAGITFVKAVTRDSYGRVTGITTADVMNAGSIVKGIAAFDSGDFSVTVEGLVSIKNSGVSNTQLENSAVTIGSSTVSLGGTLTAVSGLSSLSSTSFVGTITFVDGGTP